MQVREIELNYSNSAEKVNVQHSTVYRDIVVS